MPGFFDISELSIPMQIRLFLSLLFTCLLLASVSKARALTALPPSAGLTVAIDAATGAYTVKASDPAWTFAGTVGGPMTNVTVMEGSDKIGAYREVAFRWQAGGPLKGAIRAYRTRPIFQFSVTTPQALPKLTQDFPAFDTFPQNLHTLSFQGTVFSPHIFRLSQTSTPWILFDDQAHTAILSPASDFFVSQMHGDGHTKIASGLDVHLTNLPAGFTHRTLLTIGTGIGKTLHTWGDALTADSGKKRPPDSADLLIKYLGYWTDNGAYYYYNYDKSKGYAGTLLNLVQRYRQENIPIHYLQLDSWWYQKTQFSPTGQDEGPKKASLPRGTWNAYGGILDYSASPDLFPQGLAAYQKAVGLPLVVHGRWIAPTSPYHQTYKISGIAAVDPRWWDDRTQYLKASGVITYEQDWLSETYYHSPEMASTLTAGSAFTDNMARATQQRGLTVQYCMALPQFFLQGSHYPNLTTIRTSDDRLDRNKWNDFLYTSLLADAMHIRPFTDVFMSTEMDNLTLATLSSGPVGIGDALGSESRPNILRAVRADGVIVNPEATLLPTDATIIADALGQHTPLVAATETDNGVRTVYAFSYMRHGDSPVLSFTPASLGLTGTVYISRTSDNGSKKQDAAEQYTDTLTAPDWEQYDVAPVGRSGIAFMGDAEMIVGTGRQRIPSVQDAPGRLTVTVAFAPGERAVTLHGYAPSAPSVSVAGGQAQPVTYDATSGHFTVAIAPNAGDHSLVINGDPVTLVTVIFRIAP